MSLESDRRAIGTALTASRSAISASMQASRASTFKRDLNALESGTRKAVTLSTVESKGARAATRGVSVYVAPESSSTGGGIASPLVESSFAERVYWDEHSELSPDGLFSYTYTPIREITQLDANSLEVKQQFAEPT